jgi:hypothetical protein
VGNPLHDQEYELQNKLSKKPHHYKIKNSNRNSNSNDEELRRLEASEEDEDVVKV